MEKVQQIALGNALKWLAAAGAQFAVIGPDGVQHGTLKLAPPEKPAKPKKQRALPYGYWSKNVKPALQDMKPGDIRTVHSLEDKRITVDSMQANVANVCTELFGSGNYITTRVKREDGWTDIQVLRG